MNRIRVKWLSVGICIMILLAGCGQAKIPDVVNVTTIAVTQNGEVTAYQVETFDEKDYYNLTGLTSMAMSEASEYNAEHSENGVIPVVVEKVELLEKDATSVVVTYKFNSADTFTQYFAFTQSRGETLFYGTVAQAKAADYSLDAVYTSVKDGTLLSKEQVEQQTDKMILITDAKAVFYLPGKVTHISGGVYNTDGTVDTTSAEDMVIILFK